MNLDFFVVKYYKEFFMPKFRKSSFLTHKEDFGIFWKILKKQFSRWNFQPISFHDKQSLKFKADFMNLDFWS